MNVKVDGGDECPFPGCTMSAAEHAIAGVRVSFLDWHAWARSV